MNLKRGLLSFLFLTILVMGTISCEDKKDETPSIVGTWTVIDFVRTNCTGGNNSIITLDCPTFCMTFTFNADGTYVYSYMDPNYSEPDVETGTYTFAGNTLTVCDANGANCDSSTIALSGDTMAFSSVEEDGADSCDLTINMARN